jgi:hypothetical protein
MVSVDPESSGSATDIKKTPWQRTSRKSRSSRPTLAPKGNIRPISTRERCYCGSTLGHLMKFSWLRARWFTMRYTVPGAIRSRCLPLPVHAARVVPNPGSRNCSATSPLQKRLYLRIFSSGGTSMSSNTPTWRGLRETTPEFQDLLSPASVFSLGRDYQEKEQVGPRNSGFYHVPPLLARFARGLGG